MKRLAVTSLTRGTQGAESAAAPIGPAGKPSARADSCPAIAPAVERWRGHPRLTARKPGSDREKTAVRQLGELLEGVNSGETKVGRPVASYRRLRSVRARSSAWRTRPTETLPVRTARTTAR